LPRMCELLYLLFPFQITFRFIILDFSVNIHPHLESYPHLNSNDIIRLS